MSRLTYVIAIGLWLIGIAAGSLYSFHYTTTPTATDEPPRYWQASRQFTRSNQRPTLIMFAHPRCPCTRASLAELSLLMAGFGERVDAHVIFFMPKTSSDDWASTDLWQSAGRIPGVTRRIDLAGREQRLFGARVSGEVFLYQPNGELIFHGGITPVRGHVGDNRGRLTLERYLKHHDLPTEKTLVFGCELESRNDRSTRCERVK